MSDECFSLREIYSLFCGDEDVKVNSHVLDVLARTPAQVVHLNLSGNRLRSEDRVSDEDVRLLCQCLRSFRGVTGLDLKFNSITDSGLVHLLDLLQEERPWLRSLDLTFNNILSDGAESLAQTLKVNSSLLSLRLSGNQIGTRGAMALADLLRVNGRLQELDLSDCDLSTQSVIALTICLKNNVSLCSLDISRPLLFSQQEEWSVHLSEMLEVNSRLVELHLGKTGLSSTGIQQLSHGLKVNTCLRYLDLRCNRVTYDGVRHLTTVLAQNPTLEVIDLSANRIEDRGAMLLSDIIARPDSSLRELSVNSNNIRTSGLLSLTGAMTTSPRLTHLYIWGNHLDEPVCKAVRALMSSGRLSADHTDVSPYQVDGRVFLAEVFQKLRRRFHQIDDSAPYVPSGSAPSGSAPSGSAHNAASDSVPSAATSDSLQLSRSEDTSRTLTFDL